MHLSFQQTWNDGAAPLEILTSLFFFRNKKWCLLFLSSQRFEHLETYSVRLLHLYFTSYDLKTFLLSWEEQDHHLVSSSWLQITPILDGCQELLLLYPLERIIQACLVAYFSSKSSLLQLLETFWIVGGVERQDPVLYTAPSERDNMVLNTARLREEGFPP